MRRSDIPEPLTDVRLWPSVDPGALQPPPRAIYQQREQAIHAYLLGVPLADIARNNMIDASFLTRLLARCLALHTDGRIQASEGLFRMPALRHTAGADKRTAGRRAAA
jgi:putative transposase